MEQEQIIVCTSKEAIKRALARYKNIIICGIQGVGKLTNTIKAVMDWKNVCLIENTFDFDGKTKAKGYEKYINYLLSLKSDLIIVDNLFSEKGKAFTESKEDRVLIIDGIFGRNESDINAISSFFENYDVRVILIDRCIRYLEDYLESFEIVLELTDDGAVILPISSALEICKVLNKSLA
ncbi:MAG: hypothetical protein N3A62_01335 [Thermodesulfovibrionales bacterium]|nr:hypothetical protein [Thermodesulfovibrionales bacterium]